MSREVFATALRNSLKEIRNICPEVKGSFLFTKDGALVAEDGQVHKIVLEKVICSFRSLSDKAAAIGGVETFLINGADSRVYISYAKDMYLAISMSKDVDTDYLRSVTRVIIPTVLKLLESVIPASLHFTPSLQLMVDNLRGLRSRLSGDTVEIDRETLKQWSELFDGKDVNEVEIEADNGKRARCKVRVNDDSKLQGKGLIRMPEKPFHALQVKRGELVKVRPVDL